MSEENDRPMKNRTVFLHVYFLTVPKRERRLVCVGVSSWVADTPSPRRSRCVGAQNGGVSALLGRVLGPFCIGNTTYYQGF
jgi:hypothetical protein